MLPSIEKYTQRTTESWFDVGASILENPQMPLDRPQRIQEWLAGLPVTPQAAETGKQQSTVARPVVGASRWSFK
jgi:hypothetical protein